MSHWAGTQVLVITKSHSLQTTFPSPLIQSLTWTLCAHTPTPHYCRGQGLWSFTTVMVIPSGCLLQDRKETISAWVESVCKGQPCGVPFLSLTSSFHGLSRQKTVFWKPTKHQEQFLQPYNWFWWAAAPFSMFLQGPGQLAGSGATTSPTGTVLGAASNSLCRDSPGAAGCLDLAYGLGKLQIQWVPRSPALHRARGSHLAWKQGAAHQLHLEPYFQLLFLPPVKHRF